jgi:hypothetical protein
MITSAIVKLQVPMEKSLRDALASRAKFLGFDSTQAYVRFLAKAEVDGRKVDFDAGEWPEPSQEVADRINNQAKQALIDARAGKLKVHHSTEDFMRDLDA